MSFFTHYTIKPTTFLVVGFALHLFVTVIGGNNLLGKESSNNQSILKNVVIRSYLLGDVPMIQNLWFFSGFQKFIFVDQCITVRM